jgi:hypothetical protein
VYKKAVTWLRRLVACLSQLRPGFAPGSDHVGFVADKMEFRKGTLRVLLFSHVSIIAPWLSILMYNLRGEQKARWWPQLRDSVPLRGYEH